MISNDDLRRGAALVRNLKDNPGDVSARLVLSDFIEEYGIPNRAGEYANQGTVARTVNELRSVKEPIRVGRPETYTVKNYIIGQSFTYCLYTGPERTVWVGTWPLWAWTGVDAAEETFSENPPL